MGKLNSVVFKKLLVTLLILLISVSIFYGILNKKAMPIIISYANSEAKKSAIDILRNTGLKEINKIIDSSDLYNISKNNKNEIESIDFNIPVLNEILIIVSKKVREKLYTEQQKNNNMIYNVPMGVWSGNAFFMNTGPKVPVKIEYKGNVGLDIKSNVKPYGVDSALIEVYIRVTVTQTAIIPFQSKDIKIVSDIPVIMKVIKGTTSGVLIDKSSSYNLPIN